MSPRYLWKVFEAGKLKMLVSGRGRRGKLQACLFVTLSFRPEFHHRIRPCIIWSYLIYWRWQELLAEIFFVDDADSPGDRLKWWWWWWFSWWLLQVRPRGQCLLPNLGRLRFKPIRLQSPVKLHFAQYQRKMLKIFWTHDFNTWKQEKEGKCLQIHWGIEALSLKFQPIAALVLIQWPFSGLCVPIVDPKVKEDRVEALQNFFQVFGSITFYHFIYVDHIHFTQNLTH